MCVTHADEVNRELLAFLREPRPGRRRRLERRPTTDATMFEAVRRARRRDAARRWSFARVGGSGPPLLLLHGYPQTHLMWHAAAPLLAERFTVVAADLPGYGASFRPAPAPDHAPHSKRALARDLVEAMAALGHERFAVAGHDRGGRVAYRMALDHPDRVDARWRCSTSCRPARCGRAPTPRLALALLALGVPRPARAAARAPDRGRPRRVLRLPRAQRSASARAPGRYPAELMAAYRRLLDDPSTVRGDLRGLPRRRRASTASTTTPTAAGAASSARCSSLWSARGALPRLYGDVLDVWRPWAREVTRPRRSTPATSSSRTEPEEVADELTDLLEPIADP